MPSAQQQSHLHRDEPLTDWDFEEWKEECERQRLHHSYKIQTSSDVYKSVLSAGQNASRAIFLLSAGGAVALMSYAAQRPTICSSIFWALFLFSVSALLSTALMGIVYLQLGMDSVLLQKIMYTENKTKEKELITRKDRYNNIYDHICIALWIASFILIITAAIIVFFASPAFTISPTA